MLQLRTGWTFLTTTCIFQRMIQRKQAPVMKTDQETVFSKEDGVFENLGVKKILVDCYDGALVNFKLIFLYYVSLIIY
jgi:hypothetical protein